MAQQQPPLSVDEFASRIKAKYPQYADMDNFDLATRIVQKYPEYESQVDLKKNFQQPSLGGVESGGAAPSTGQTETPFTWTPLGGGEPQQPVVPEIAPTYSAFTNISREGAPEQLQLRTPAQIAQANIGRPQPGLEQFTQAGVQPFQPSPVAEPPTETDFEDQAYPSIKKIGVGEPLTHDEFNSIPASVFARRAMEGDSLTIAYLDDVIKKGLGVEQPIPTEDRFAVEDLDRRQLTTLGQRVISGEQRRDAQKAAQIVSGVAEVLGEQLPPITNQLNQAGQQLTQQVNELKAEATRQLRMGNVTLQDYNRYITELNKSYEEVLNSEPFTTMAKLQQTLNSTAAIAAFYNEEIDQDLGIQTFAKVVNNELWGGVNNMLTGGAEFLDTIRDVVRDNLGGSWLSETDYSELWNPRLDVAFGFTGTLTDEELEQIKNPLLKTVAEAGVGVVNSLPALAVPYGVGMFAQMYGYAATEAREKGMSSGGILLYAGAQASAAAALERFGFRNLMTNKAVIGQIANNALRRLQTGTTKVTVEALERAINAETKAFVPNYLKRIGTGFASEFETGFAQAVSEGLVKEAANLASNQELFNEEEVGLTLGNLLYQGTLEGIGGSMLSSVFGLVSRDRYNFSEMSNKEIDFLTSALKNNAAFDTQFKQFVQGKVQAGAISDNDAETTLNAYEQLKEKLNSVPSEYSAEDKREVLDLLSERSRLQEVLGRLAPGVGGAYTNRINEINNRVAEIDGKYQVTPTGQIQTTQPPMGGEQMGAEQEEQIVPTEEPITPQQEVAPLESADPLVRYEGAPVLGVVGERVSFTDANGNLVEGDAYVEGQRVVVEDANGRIYDTFGSVEELSNLTEEQLPFNRVQPRILATEQGFTYNSDAGVMPVGTRITPQGEGLKAVKRDKNGVVKRVVVTAEDGKTYSLTGDDANALAYAMMMDQISQGNLDAKVVLNENANNAINTAITEQAQRRAQQAETTPEGQAVPTPTAAAEGRDGRGTITTQTQTDETQEQPVLEGVRDGGEQAQEGQAGTELRASEAQEEVVPTEPPSMGAAAREEAQGKETSFEEAGKESKDKSDGKILGQWILDNSKVGDTITDEDGNGYEVIEIDRRGNVTLRAFEINENGEKMYLEGADAYRLVSKTKLNQGDLFEYGYTDSDGNRVVKQYKYNAAPTPSMGTAAREEVTQPVSTGTLTQEQATAEKERINAQREQDLQQSAAQIPVSVEAYNTADGQKRYEVTTNRDGSQTVKEYTRNPDTRLFELTNENFTQYTAEQAAQSDIQQRLAETTGEQTTKVDVPVTVQSPVADAINQKYDQQIADIDARTEKTQEQTTQERLDVISKAGDIGRAFGRAVNNIKKALGDRVPVRLLTREEFIELTGEDARGAYDKEAKIIYINVGDGTGAGLNQANIRAVYHEAIHPLLTQRFGEATEEFIKFREDLKKAIRKSLPKTSADNLIQRLEEFESSYAQDGEVVMAEEFMTELTAILSSEGINAIGNNGFVSRLKALINNLLAKMGVNFRLTTNSDVVNFVNETAASLRAGEAIQQRAEAQAEGMQLSRGEAISFDKEYTRDEIIALIPEVRTNREAFILQKKYRELINETNAELDRLNDEGKITFQEWKDRRPTVQETFKVADELRKRGYKYENLAGDVNASEAYNFTSIDNAINILEENSIEATSQDEEGITLGVSLTTNPDFNNPFFATVKEYGVQGQVVSSFDASNIKFTFDLPKIKSDGYKAVKGSEKYGTFLGEEEVRVIAKDNTEISNIRDYIKSIEVTGEINSQDLQRLQNAAGNIPVTQKGAPGMQLSRGTAAREEVTQPVPAEQSVNVDFEAVRSTDKAGGKIGKGLKKKTVQGQLQTEQTPEMSIEYAKRENPIFFIKIANQLSQYPLVKGVLSISKVGMDGNKPMYIDYKNPTKQNIDKAQKIYDVFKEQVKGNLKYLMDNAPADLKELMTLWYDGANKLANEFGTRYNYTTEQAAGVMAALSPQKDWYQNVKLAELIMKGMRDNPVLTNDMIDKMISIRNIGYESMLKKNNREALESQLAETDRIIETLRSNVGKPLNEISNEWKPYVIRLNAEINESKNYNILLPDGTPVGLATNTDGTPSSWAFGSFGEIGKAVSILLDGSLENISTQLGNAHKIRNFYNNIIDPMSDAGDITMDTHAIAAATLLPLSGNSTEVGHNLGGIKSDPIGLVGNYFAYADAYRELAAETGYLPRQIQSITWEVIRGLYTKQFKTNAKNVNEIRDIFDNFEKGKITIDEARRQATAKADGFTEPTWGRFVSEESRERSRQESERRGTQGTRPDAIGRGTGRGLAPKPIVTFEEAQQTEGVTERKMSFSRVSSPSSMDRVINSTQSSIKKYFRPGGNLPRTVYNKYLKLVGAESSILKKIDRQRSTLERVIKKEFGVGYNNLNQQIKDAMDLALRGDVNALMTLPTDVAKIVTDMRQQVDAMSQAAINLGMLSSDMVATFQNNMGVYLTRTYRRFSDPTWADKVPESVRNAAELFVQQQNPNLTPDEVTGYIDYLLYSGEENIGSLFKQSPLGSKDVNILKNRKDIPKELRDLFGEYGDPFINYSNTLTKLGSLNARQKFLEGVKQDGLGTFLFERPTGKFIVRIAGEGSQTMSPLNGLYTTPEIAEAFKGALEPSSPNFKGINGMILQKWMMLTALAKIGKTVGSPLTHFRNFWSNTLIMVNNGYMFDAKTYQQIVPTFVTLIKDMANRGDASFEQYILRLTELGVLGESINAGDIKALIKDIDRGESDILTAIANNRATKAIGKGVKGVQRLYQAEDDFYKILSYEVEKKRLMDAYGTTQSQDWIESRAAEKTSTVTPTYSRVPLIIKELRINPLVGTFVSFPYEILRTYFSTINLALTELNTPQEAAIGRKRLAGIVTNALLVPSLAALSRMMIGVDDEEDLALRTMLPPWSKNSDLIYLERDEDGLPRFIDAGYTDPYNYIRKPMNILLLGAKNDEELTGLFGEALGQVFSPFLSEEILAQHVREIMSNKKTSTGTYVYNPEDTPNQRYEDIFKHLWKAAQPGVVSQFVRIEKAITGTPTETGRVYDFDDEVLGLPFGQKRQRVDPMTAMQFRFTGASKRFLDAKKIYNSAYYNPNRSEEEISEAYNRSVESSTRIYRELKEQYDAAVLLMSPVKGVRDTKDELFMMMIDAQVPALVRIALDSGQDFIPYMEKPIMEE